MRIGFYTNYTPDVAAMAQKIGFRSLELSAWPHSSLNADAIAPGQIDAIKADLDARDIEISALGYYPNYLSPDAAEREETARYFRRVLQLAAEMGVPVVATFAGRNPGLSVEDNLPLFKEVFSGFCDTAETLGVKIAIENCPMMNRFSMHGENIAFSPEIWERMFELVPSDHLGIELDPSHCVWLGIDYIKAIYDFGDRIFHVHAKDMEIRRDILARSGIYGTALQRFDGLGHGWWRARAPGWGEVDWAKFITALIEVGYRGNLDIEHEDDVFAAASKLGRAETEADIVKSYGRETTGLIVGYKTLARYVPDQAWPR